jgi:hypothetical protein
MGSYVERYVLRGSFRESGSMNMGAEITVPGQRALLWPSICPLGGYIVTMNDSNLIKSGYVLATFSLVSMNVKPRKSRAKHVLSEHSF